MARPREWSENGWSAEPGGSRVVIDALRPGHVYSEFPLKRVQGEPLDVEAIILVDGHDELKGRLLWRHEKETDWSVVPLKPSGNDLWRASFAPTELGIHFFTVEAEIDRFASWRRDVGKKAAFDTLSATDLAEGALILLAMAKHPELAGEDRAYLLERSDELARLAADFSPSLPDWLTEPRLLELSHAFPDKSRTRFKETRAVMVERRLSLFSSWYELFPRSFGEGERHGTLRDVERQLSYVADMGFDVLYLPPIHPIGRTGRKGPNNTLVAGPSDPGSPWAIGSEAGGHKSIHPELGTLEDFRALRRAAESLGIELAMDVAFQCSPDHPYVTQHPEWFKKRPDGTIRCAENPPKIYQDIYPFDFETEALGARSALWQELLSIVLYWAEEGIRIFRVDNPHTKPFVFWRWLLAETKRRHPEAIFLSEAFTRPHKLYHLARIGFSQSYTYFTWRRTKAELESYVRELLEPEIADYMRPNFWPNTPDILPEHLHHAGRPAFAIRLVLAATLSASYGIYGPAFELMENVPREPGSEEYEDSEKYRIKSWDLAREDSLAPLIRRINRIRREHPALQQNRRFRFLTIPNDQILAFAKEEGDDRIIVVVSLDPYHVQSGFLELPLWDWGIPESETYQMHDLLQGARYYWSGSTNYVELDPNVLPAHVFHLKRWLRSERDFDYFA